MTKEELKGTRKDLGWTQEKIAKELGLSLRHYCRLEAGEYPIQGAVLRVCEYLEKYGVLEKD